MNTKPIIARTGEYHPTTEIGPNRIVDIHGEIWLWRTATWWDSLKWFLGLSYRCVPYQPWKD